MSWPSSVSLGATFDDKDQSITHHVVDRPLQGHKFLSRYVLRTTHVKTHSMFCLSTGLNMVELASLNSVVDRFVHTC